jgi:hypothetical protein
MPDSSIIDDSLDELPLSIQADVLANTLIGLAHDIGLCDPQNSHERNALHTRLAVLQEAIADTFLQALTEKEENPVHK